MANASMTDQDFAKLLSICQEIASTYPEGVVFIGGIAIYLHSINHKETRALAEFTHDADFYISLADLADLRDREEVVANRRLNKHQIIKSGFEFDIYTERHAALVVPYDQAAAHAVSYDKLRVAGLEHLLVLKLEAYRERRFSAKGQKDAKDIIRAVLVADARGKALDRRRCIAFLSEDHIRLLEQIQRGPEFLSLTKGNAHDAKRLRDRFSKGIKLLLRRTIQE